MSRHPSGYVLYHGASMLDGQPIVAIANAFAGSSNPKTGYTMIQTYILRADIDPQTASRTGADASICGTCPHRGEYDPAGDLIPSTRSCYVTLMHGPRTVYSAWRRGVYVDMTHANTKRISKLFAGRKVRLGAYGDPAAVPIGVWHAVLAQAAGQTGYTHAWRATPELAPYVMASCESSEDRVHARALGFRTFRVASATGWTRGDHEVLCAASAEAGHKTTCDSCMACGGTGSKARADIVIPLHGYGTNAAMRRGIVMA